MVSGGDDKRASGGHRPDRHRITRPRGKGIEQEGCGAHPKRCLLWCLGEYCLIWFWEGPGPSLPYGPIRLLGRAYFLHFALFVALFTLHWLRALENRTTSDPQTIGTRSHTTLSPTSPGRQFCRAKTPQPVRVAAPLRPPRAHEPRQPRPLTPAFRAAVRAVLCVLAGAESDHCWRP